MEGAADLPTKPAVDEDEEEAKRCAKRQNQSAGLSLAAAFKSVRSEASAMSRSDSKSSEAQAGPSEAETMNETASTSQIAESNSNESAIKVDENAAKDVPMETEEDNEDENQLHVVCAKSRANIGNAITFSFVHFAVRRKKCCNIFDELGSGLSSQFAGFVL